jgi:hypothetical protein
MFDQILSLLWPDLRSQAATNPRLRQSISLYGRSN